MCDHLDEELKKIVGSEFREDRFHIGKVFMKVLGKHSEKITQIDVITGESETNGSILERSIRLAKWMKSVGIKTGDIIVISGVNQLDQTIVVVAALFLGAAVFPIDYSLKFDEALHFIKLAEPKLIFCDPNGILDTIERVLNHTKLIAKIITFGKSDRKTLQTFQNVLENEVCDTKEIFLPNNFDPNKTISFLHSTSGSTGLPKAVAITHKAFIIRLLEFWYPESHSFENDIFMAASPIHWITATAMMMTCLVFGAKRILSSKSFTADVAFKIMNTYKPTIALLGPHFLISMLENDKHNKADWTSFKLLLLAGSIVSKKTAIEAQERLVNADVVICYGMTEASGVIASSTLRKPPDNLPLGRIRNSLQHKVVNHEGEELGPFENGELLLKSNYLFKEYYGNNKATKETLTSDGWLKSGDIVYYNDDKEYFYVDRAKLMMKYKNNQVSTAEIEKVISTHPGVASVTVDKLEFPPDDHPLAFVVRAPNAKVSEQEIKDLVANKLADYKQLRGGVVFLDSMPMTVAGKVDRKAFKDIKMNMMNKNITA